MRKMLKKKKFIFLDRMECNKKPKKGCYVSNTNQIVWKVGSLNALKILKKMILKP